MCFANFLFFCKFTIFLANSPWIHYLFCELTIYFATQLWFYFPYHEFTIFFPEIQWIYYLYCCYTENSLSHCEFTINLLSFSWIHYKLTVFIANLRRIPIMFLEFTMITVDVWHSLIDYQFTINFANLL